VFSGGISFEKEHTYSHFIRSELLDSVEFCYRLNGNTEIREIGLIATDYTLPYYDEAYSVKLNKNGIYGDIFIRSRQNGDCITVNGMTKRIKRILCDKHIPSHLRDRIPIICDERGIVALGNLCVRDGCKCNNNDEKIKITFYKFDKDNGGC